MKLLHLTLTNFAGIASLSLDFPGGCSGSIYGDNATGKTTVKNAVEWLLFGAPISGVKNYTPKTKSADGEAHHLNHVAEAVFSACDGRTVTLRGDFHETYKRVRGSAGEVFGGHTVDYFVNGVPVKEKEYFRIVASYAAGADADPGEALEKMKLLMSPDYFPAVLPFPRRREWLLSVCGDLTEEEILESNPELRELRERLRMPAAAGDFGDTPADRFYTVEEYRKIAAARKSKLGKQINELPGRIDEVNRALASAPAEDEETLRERAEKLSGELDALRASKAAEEKKEDESAFSVKASLLKRKEELLTEISAFRNAYEEKREKMRRERETELRRAGEAADELRKKRVDLEIAAQKCRGKLSYMETLRRRLAEEYAAVRSETFDESATVCPTCGRAYPEEKAKALRAEFEARKKARLDAIDSRGKTEASKAVIEDLAEKLRALEQEEKKTALLLDGVEAELRLLREKGSALPAIEGDPLYLRVTKDLQSVEDALREKADRAKELQAARKAAIGAGYGEREKALAEKVRAAREALTRCGQADTLRRRIACLEAEEKALAAQYEETERDLYLCDLFTRTKVSAINEKVGAKFKSVRFRLFQEQLNGGVKEDCEVMIPCEGGRLVPYAFANNAARINAGLEIISTFSEHWKVRMPVFIDNAESVAHLIGIGTQTVRLVVSEEDKKLRREMGA